MLGDMWRSTSNEEKSPYQKHERAEREIYKQRIALWREQKAAKEKVNPGRFYNQDQKTLLCSENFTKNRDHSLDHWSSRSNIVPSEKSFWKSGTRCDEKFIIEERLRLTDCDDYHTQQQMKISSASENPHGTFKTHSFTKYSEFFSSERRHHFKSDVDATNLDQEPEIETRRASPTNRTVFQIHLPERFVTVVHWKNVMQIFLRMSPIRATLDRWVFQIMIF